MGKKEQPKSSVSWQWQQAGLCAGSDAPHCAPHCTLTQLSVWAQVVLGRIRSLGIHYFIPHPTPPLLWIIWVSPVTLTGHVAASGHPPHNIELGENCKCYQSSILLITSFLPLSVTQKRKPMAQELPDFTITRLSFWVNILSYSSLILTHLNVSTCHTTWISTLRFSQNTWLYLFPYHSGLHGLLSSFFGRYLLNTPISSVNMIQDQTFEELCFEDAKGKLVKFRQYLPLKAIHRYCFKMMATL